MHKAYHTIPLYEKKTFTTSRQFLAIKQYCIVPCLGFVCLMLVRRLVFASILCAYMHLARAVQQHGARVGTCHARVMTSLTWAWARAACDLHYPAATSINRLLLFPILKTAAATTTITPRTNRKQTPLSHFAPHTTDTFLKTTS